MKIMNAATPKPATATAPSRTNAKGASSPAATTASSSSATAASTADPATRLSQLEAQFSQSDFDAGKVGEVTDAIAKGQYKVNAGAVADKLLENAATLSNKPSGKN
jgi:negative regulator of flagellin synthesis FlgM